MFRSLPSPVALEEEVLQFWDAERIFARSLEASKGRPTFVFYEGPPTANGTPHNGHVLTRVIKDAFPRYRTMRGYHVDRKAGWDTHGLPVEVEVERKLNAHGHEGIEAYGLEAFNRACVNSIFTYVDEWEKLTRQIGFWVDLDEAYATYQRSYVESVWWALSELFRKGLLYKGHKVVWWWPQGGTTLSAAEVGLGYREVDEVAVTVRFVDAEDPSVSYLAWTTTPWTLPSNVALAVGERISYVFCEDPEDASRQVVVAEALAERYGLTPLRTVIGADLVGRRYTPIYDFGPVESGRSFIIVPGHHVTTSAGTGIVHTAPAFGEDDMRVAQVEGLGLLQWVEPSGRFSAEAGAFAGVFCKDADKDIVRDLRDRGLLFKKETVRHDYPFCWRADTDPLIQYARPAWFIRTTARIDEAIENNQHVGWQPSHIKDGRFGDFLRNNVDWALSRERFWGTPLNIWTCDACEHQMAPSSAEEIRTLNPDAFDPDVDLHLQVHRPWIDSVALPCPACGGVMHRVPEVIDCWFDSGCMPFAQWGFPHQQVDRFREAFPADFISEAIDQTRGWFYSLLMISTLVFDEETCRKYGLDAVGYPRPYKNCVVLGHVGDVDGRKESKSKGNYTSPNLVLRGHTVLAAVPDPTLARGQVGMKAAQVRSLDLGGRERVRLSSDEVPSADAAQFEVVAADVGAKDTVNVHPDDLVALGLPATGGRVGFAVPFDAPGADAFRWLFCASSPVTSNTRLSLRAIRDGQREFLLRLRNVYQFFSIYANIAANEGQVDFSAPPPRGVSERGPLDRWIHHRLNATLAQVTEHMDAYGLFEASTALSAFVEDLSNWYVRRSRARFWGQGPDTVDALWTLLEVLTTFSQMIAPFVPFTAEAMYRALGPLAGRGGADSVHLTLWPAVDAAHLDPTLDASMAMTRELASLGRSAREASRIKVRQPLEAITVVLADPGLQAGVVALSGLLRSELNVREVRFADEAHDFVDYTFKPDFRQLGRKLGKAVKEVAGALSAMDHASVKSALDAGGVEVVLSTGPVTLGPDDVRVNVLKRDGYEASSSASAVVALSTDLTEDLRAEGLVRELVSKVQGLRKQADLGYTDRIRLAVWAPASVRSALERFGDTLTGETLAVALTLVASPEGLVSFDVEGHEVALGITGV